MQVSRIYVPSSCSGVLLERLRSGCFEGRGVLLVSWVRVLSSGWSSVIVGPLRHSNGTRSQRGHFAECNLALKCIEGIKE